MSNDETLEHLRRILTLVCNDPQYKNSAVVKEAKDHLVESGCSGPILFSLPDTGCSMISVED